MIVNNRKDRIFSENIGSAVINYGSQVYFEDFVTWSKNQGYHGGAFHIAAGGFVDLSKVEFKFEKAQISHTGALTFR